MSDTPHGRDDEGYFAALDFGEEVGTDDLEPSAIDVFDTDEPAEVDDVGTRHAIELLSEDTDHTEVTGDPEDELAAQLVTVTNPAETVTVWAMAGGEIHRVELSPEVVSMTASDLASEIIVIAHLAQERGQSRLYADVLGAFNEMGITDNQVLSEFLEEGMELSSPKQAAKSQAEVFATRYGD